MTITATLMLAHPTDQTKPRVGYRILGDKIAPNGLRKGDRVVMKYTGWRGTVADNARGVRRMVTVEGWETETGSVYVWDIAGKLVDEVAPEGIGADGDWLRRAGAIQELDLPPAYEKQREAVRASGF